MNERVERLLGDPRYADRPERFCLNVSLRQVRSIRSKRPSCLAFWSLQNGRVNESMNEFVRLFQRSVRSERIWGSSRSDWPCEKHAERLTDLDNST